MIGVINYDLIFRRPELLKVNFDTVMLDESSIIQNRTSKRSKAILKLKTKNTILLSGTPTGGKYERLWSQIKLLGWDISEDLYFKQYIDFYYDMTEGFPRMVITGYKNVDRLKAKLREHGAHFLKTEEVFDLPTQTFENIYVKKSTEYKKFEKSRIIMIGEKELVGDTALTFDLYKRMFCGSYNKEKMKVLEDLLSSTDDRVIVFYNWTNELYAIEDLCTKLDRPLSIVNGERKDLSMYHEYENSVTAIQYQAGAMGLNLQKSNKIIYFTPPTMSELFEQSKKRTHRIGQEKPCFYYHLICKGSVEERIYSVLRERKDYTDYLFEE
jgi:SNF2 family DNA or RNA helicase